MLLSGAASFRMCLCCFRNENWASTNSRFLVFLPPCFAKKVFNFVFCLKSCRFQQSSEAAHIKTLSGFFSSCLDKIVILWKKICSTLKATSVSRISEKQASAGIATLMLKLRGQKAASRLFLPSAS